MLDTALYVHRLTDRCERCHEQIYQHRRNQEVDEQLIDGYSEYLEYFGRDGGHRGDHQGVHRTIYHLQLLSVRLTTHNSRQIDDVRFYDQQQMQLSHRQLADLSSQLL